MVTTPEFLKTLKEKTENAVATEVKIGKNDILSSEDFARYGGEERVKKACAWMVKQFAGIVVEVNEQLLSEGIVLNTSSKHLRRVVEAAIDVQTQALDKAEKELLDE